ncbi:MAG: cation:proton antiporter [Microcoleaceae cyanobacterium]
MATESHFILDLVTTLGTAALGGFAANRLGQPILLGYLVSGLIIGPSGLGLLNDLSQIQALAEIGVAFLLFALGVEFSLTELKRVQKIAIQGSLLQIGLTIATVTLIAPLLGWVKNPTEGIFLGALLSLSSTAVVLKSLTERGEVNTTHGQVMLAILIAQDLALGLMLAILPALNQPSSALAIALFWALVKGALFLLGALVAGIWLVPPLMKQVAMTESSELFLLTVIALCLGVALVTDTLGLSIEMGAFIAGLMVAEIDYSDQALARILPLRDTFASLFFASIGMLINPVVLIQNIGIILGLVMMVMLGKALIIFPIVLKFGYSFKTAVITSLGLNQIGEFSFVLAQVALSLGILTEKKYLLILGTTAITLVLTPVFLKSSPRLANRLANLPGLSHYLERFRGAKEILMPEILQGHVVVAGYGRVGQVLVRMLQNQGHQVLVIDNSEAAIAKLRSHRIPYLMGDADSELVLQKTHLEQALALAIALPDPASTRLLLKRALELSPHLDVVARAHNNSEIEVLTQLGAWEVVQPEFESALEMGAHLLSTLGETQVTIQSVIRAIRTDRYRSVLPERVTNLELKSLLESTEGLKNNWIALDQSSPLVGMTLADADIRQLTGATIMEIARNNQRISYPTGETQLNAADRLFVVGSREELSLFQELAMNQSPIRLQESAWVSLTEASPGVGTWLTPGDLVNCRQGIIAIRRQGKLFKLLSKPFQFQSGDWLLLQNGSAIESESEEKEEPEK